MLVHLGGHEFNLVENERMVKLTLGRLLVYKFERTKNGCIKKPQNISYSRALFEWLDNRYGVVQETVNIKGTEITCSCDSPELQKDHDWSDGMAKHYWYECQNCGTRGAVGADSNDEVTSIQPFVEA